MIYKNNKETLTPNRLTYCGLVYQRGGRTGYDVMAQYREQITRGQDGFGYVEIQKTAKRKRFTDELDTFYNLAQSQAKDIMFHHRIPTSTKNKTVCNHPIFTDQYKHNYFLMHNGIISNSTELYRSHKELGIEYETKIGKHTFNDSETVLHELALYIEGKSTEIDCEGSIAFIMLQTDKNNKPLNLYYGRNAGNPLIVSEKNGVFRLASELEDGDLINKDILYEYNYKTRKTTEEAVPIGSHYNYCGYNDTGRYGDSGRYNSLDDYDGGVIHITPKKEITYVDPNDITEGVMSILEGLYSIKEKYYNEMDLDNLEGIKATLAEYKCSFRNLSYSDYLAFDNFEFELDDAIEEVKEIYYGYEDDNTSPNE